MESVGVNDIRRMVAQRGSEMADRVAFEEGTTGRVLTWGEIAASVANWDRARSSAGLMGGVAVACSDPIEMISHYLAALAAGVTVAPLDPTLSPDRIEVELRRLGLDAAVASSAGDGPAVSGSDEQIPTPSTPAGRAIYASPEQLAETGSMLASTTTPHAASEPREPQEFVDADPATSFGDRPALLMASSGTTGDAKVIPLTASQLVATARSVVAGHQLRAGDVGYSPLPLFHINGLVVGVLANLVSGGRLVVERRFSASRFWAVAERAGATWLNLVPAMITVLASRPAPPVEVAERVAFARSASAPLPEASRVRFERHCGVGILETYGMTEAASQIAANPRQADHRRAGSVGRAADVDICIRRADGAPARSGEIGEIQLKGARVVSEYGIAFTPGSRRPARGEGGWLATGDLGWIDSDGFVYLVGRVDDVINRGGEKVFPREIEEVLLGDPAVGSAAVVARPHPVVGEEPVAFVLPSAQAQAATAWDEPSAQGAAEPGGNGSNGVDRAALAGRLARICESSLSRSKRPAEIIVADSLPSGPTGKIRNAELRRRVIDLHDAVYLSSSGELRTDGDRDASPRRSDVLTAGAEK